MILLESDDHWRVSVRHCDLLQWNHRRTMIRWLPFEGSKILFRMAKLLKAHALAFQNKHAKKCIFACKTALQLTTAICLHSFFTLGNAVQLDAPTYLVTDQSVFHCSLSDLSSGLCHSTLPTVSRPVDRLPTIRLLRSSCCSELRENRRNQRRWTNVCQPKSYSKFFDFSMWPSRSSVG